MSLLTVWTILAVVAGVIAGQKKRSVVAWTILTFLFSPLCLLVLLSLSPTDTANERKCPFCAEWIKKEAVVCKHCDREIRKAIRI